MIQRRKTRSPATKRRPSLMSACREAAPKADYINAVYTRGENREITHRVLIPECLTWAAGGMVHSMTGRRRNRRSFIFYRVGSSAIDNWRVTLPRSLASAERLSQWSEFEPVVLLYQKSCFCEAFGVGLNGGVRLGIRAEDSVEPGKQDGRHALRRVRAGSALSRPPHAKTPGWTPAPSNRAGNRTSRRSLAEATRLFHPQ